MSTKYNWVVINKPYVYIVLEHATETTDARVHNVFVGGEKMHQYALNNVEKIKKKNPRSGYLAVLKKPLKGQKSSFANYWLFGNK